MDQYDKENRRVQYYSNGNFSDDKHFDAHEEQHYRRGMPAWAKAIIIILLVLLGIFLLAVGCNNALSSFTSSGTNTEVTADFGHDYIGALYIQDTIDENGTGLYNHQYLLNAIDAMMESDNNKGLILYVNTPGGSVYASDELYLKIKEYQETTKRPVYSSMQSQATSGGYYISASSDKIFANRNCWTGSIGVTMGSFTDVSGLLDKLGIKTTTITSGANKAMGSSVDPMTDEQKAIFQSLVDEAYEQFVQIVADGRKMPLKKVKSLADGRIYSAQQAAENGLIDEVGTFEEAISDMTSTYSLGDIAVEYFEPEEPSDLSSLFDLLAREKEESAVTNAEAVESLINLNGTFKLSYMAEVRK